ncbi:MAG: signal peptide peptidase SppA [Bacteroidota bacterium]
MKFLRNLLAAILGTLIAFGILFFMFFVFFALVSSAEDEVTVESNSILELSFSEPISDYVGRDEADPFGGLFTEGNGLDDILHTIAIAADDDRIKALSLTTSFIQAGLAQTQEIREALEEFQLKGKGIYAYSDYFTQKDYYLASVADSIYLNPVGGMDFRGLATEILYLKELQEKTGVKIEVIRHGKYKSAVEPYLYDAMSAENREQITALIASIWNTMLEDISDARDISVEQLNSTADTLGARNPKLAIAAGLIDGAVHFDEYEAMLKTELNLTTEDDINYVSFSDYQQLALGKKIWSGKEKIAVIYAQGEILYGEGNKDYIGQGIIQKALQKAKNSDKVKAVVLRVNSPGGSALVSDIIWREVELVKAVKPVVVSFGNVAASGGYYIGAGGDKIFAEPTTVTGSIGVFGTIPNVHELSKTIGVNAEQVGTNKNSIEYSVFEPMTDTFKKVVEESIEDTYDVFLERVAQGRNMSIAEVDSLAQGRVWSGTDAVQNGLVDELGSLEDAIYAAAELAELEEFGIRKYPKYKSDFERFMEDFGGARSEWLTQYVEEEIGTEAYHVLQDLKKAKQFEGVQARLPYSLNIK